METRRLISIAIAGVVALLVMWAGKSCTESIRETNHKSEDYQSTFNEGYNGGYENYADYEDGTYAVQAEPTTAAEEKYAPGVQTVTNLLGEVVGTVTATTTTFTTLEPLPIKTTTTVSKSILESYNEQKQQENIGGNILDHEQQTVTTAVTVKPMDPDDIILNIG